MRTLQKKTIGVVITSAHGKIVSVNAALRAMIGDDSIGGDLCALRPPVERKRFERIKSQLAGDALNDNLGGNLSGNIWRGKTRLIAKDGAILHLAEAIHVLRGADGGIAQFVHFLHDLDTRCAG